MYTAPESLARPHLFCHDRVQYSHHPQRSGLSIVEDETTACPIHAYILYALQEAAHEIEYLRRLSPKPGTVYYPRTCSQQSESSPASNVLPKPERRGRDGRYYRSNGLEVRMASTLLLDEYDDGVDFRIVGFYRGYGVVAWCFESETREFDVTLNVHDPYLNVQDNQSSTSSESPPPSVGPRPNRVRDHGMGVQEWWIRGEGKISDVGRERGESRVNPHGFQVSDGSKREDPIPGGHTRIWRSEVVFRYFKGGREE
ncbi:hypothetical protein BDY19DRAFT_910543 [Irpex rosettiformis]|uniref:Uncharacterized protein n=1 Tax=Irpex rosettiformis TaxID=378272 RepID=A0ACB8TNF3_9APHY|nr:hypothetical protein BDY19DRAFT_910543 [Irpex rosettiformis]